MTEKILVDMGYTLRGVDKSNELTFSSGMKLKTPNLVAWAYIFEESSKEQE
jgi:hypothetical protein